MRAHAPTVVLILALAACGGTVAHTSSGSGTGSGGATSGATVASGTGSGNPNGCSGNDCAPGEFCNFGVGFCGKPNSPRGACTPMPDGCGGPMQPVCGCNGMTYQNACFAQFYGVSIEKNGPCAPFACGMLTCDATTQYCSDAPDIQQPNLPPYSCQPLPSGCGTSPSCACLSTICGTCTGDGTAGLTKYCPGQG